MSDSETSLLTHLLALRKAILNALAGVAILYIPGYFAAPYVLRFLVNWCFPKGTTGLHYFAPMEVFVIQLQMALILAIAASFPWGAAQLWQFVLPALRQNEKKIFAAWLTATTVLFVIGAAFCITFILPLIMKFSASFETDAIKPIIGLGAFARLAGGITVAFGIMFQAPIAVLLAVRLGTVSTTGLAKARPYVYVSILILAALLTPPDVVSQLLLALPTALLFETGLLVARRIERCR